MDQELISMLVKEVQSLRKEVSEIRSLLEITNHTNKENTFVENIYKAEIEGNGLEHKISNLLHELKIPTSLQGYFMLRKAIALVYQDFSLINNVTNRLYPLIAKEFNTTPSRAERAIRHAIETSWSKNNLHSVYSYHFIESKPTNTQFISLIADKFRVEKAI